MMKQFGKTMLSLIGLAVAAAMLSAIPAYAASPVVVAHAFDANVGWFTLLDPNNPTSLELVTFDVESTGNVSYTLGYSIFDFGGGFSAFGNGSIPASSVTVSGGSVNSGNVTVTLNVNTCDVAGFTTLPPGTCGTFNVAWVEMPASIGGSSDFRGDSRSTLPGGGTVVRNGETTIFSALTTGTALGFAVPTPTVGSLIKETNVTKTVTP